MKVCIFLIWIDSLMKFNLIEVDGINIIPYRG